MGRTSLALASAAAPPIWNIYALFFSPAALSEALAARGYSAPTPVQAAVLEPGADGRDLVVSAQTGSGKTVAFGLNMAPQLLDESGGMPRAGAPLALVIAPTRELALQVSRELVWLYGKAGGRVATCVGGMDPSKERRALGRGAHIVVGTPGRLRDHLERGALDLSSLRVACSTRPTRCSTWAFARTGGDPRRVAAERRTLMFSATCPSRSSRSPSAISATRCASRRSARSAGMATSATRR
jgi:ATP-dependent RNA helicase DeaD